MLFRSVREGKVKLIARGAPFDGTAPYAEVIIDCKVLVTGVSLSAGASSMNVGDTLIISAGAKPENATVGGIVITLSNPSAGTLASNGDGTWTFTARAAGNVKITAASADNPRKLKRLSISVRAG